MKLLVTVAGAATLLTLGATFAADAQRPKPAQLQPVLGARTLRVIERDGLRFKDLDRDGSLAPYEDWRRTAAERARDLISRMTLEEKAGTMMHGTARSAGQMGGAGVGTGYDLAAARAIIDSSKINSLITRLGGDPRSLAEQNNALQAIAESTRLGIPLTISTDPRHHFQYVLGASVQSGRFSQWPETLGLAAIGDAVLVRRFADIARREYRAVGIHETLSPQADLATEPRWSRINGTFGENAQLAKSLVRAYVEGFQHGARGVQPDGVLAVVKHWVGYGAQKDGLDSHNAYGRFASIDEAQLGYHIEPFLGAFAAKVAGVMPTYAILEGATLDGKPLEQVGAGFNGQLLTDLLRRKHGFDGVILTDWAITNDCLERCLNGAPPGVRPSFADLGMPWGVESLPKRQRFIKAVNAGVDQFGGTEEAQNLVEAVRAGQLQETRIDESVRLIMTQKFQQGLFENALVDPDVATRTVGTELFRAEALRAQRRSLVLLENKKSLLPLGVRPRRVYLHGVDSAAVKRIGWSVATDLANADIAIVRLNSPFETLHPGYIFGSMQHDGDLSFRDGNADYEAFKRISAAVPTIVTVYLDRPAILTGVRDGAAALLANFGVSDEALLDVLIGRVRPEGRLPFELPASMDAVRAQRPDVAHDTVKPLYPIGFGLSYKAAR